MAKSSIKSAVGNDPYRIGGMRWALLAALVLLVASPVPIVAQQFFDDDTTYYEDEYYDDYDAEGYFGDEEEYGVEGDEYYEDEYFDDEGEYYEDEGEYYEDDAYFEDEFYDEGEFEEYDDEFGDEGFDEGLDLADDQAGEIVLVEVAEIEQKRIKEPRVLRGYTVKLAVISPWYAGLGLNSWWYSNIDARLAVDIPRKGDLAGVTLGYTLEISTYSFEHTHPSGGQFGGVAMLAMMRVPLGPLTVTAGGGVYGFATVTSGMIFGASYTLPFFKYIDITMDSRLNYVQGGLPAGAAYWLDVGGSFGMKF